METIVVIGDELSGAAFRLAGAAVRTPLPELVTAEFARALETARLVVLTGAAAEQVEPDLLRAALARETPLVLVLPAFAGADVGADFARGIRAVLGIEA